MKVPEEDAISGMNRNFRVAAQYIVNGEGLVLLKGVRKVSDATVAHNRLVGAGYTVGGYTHVAGDVYAVHVLGGPRDD